MLQTLTGNIWTHKAVFDYTALQSGSPDFLLNESIVTNSTGGNYYISTPTPVNLSGMTATVISGTGLGETATVGPSGYTPNTSVIYFPHDFSPTLDTTSVIQFQRYSSYKDIGLFALPTNHMITSVKITTLVSYNAGLHFGQQNNVYVFIGDTFPTPINHGDTVVTSIHGTYGVSNLTVPTGSDETYEYGSFRWFTVSSPGAATYARNLLSGNTNTGSYCIPTRVDGPQLYARFCIFDYTDNSYLTSDVPKLNTNWNFNSNVTSGVAEIAIQYMAI
jgi:hypothetical protein